jgi:hypothetical protein
MWTTLLLEDCTKEKQKVNEIQKNKILYFMLKFIYNKYQGNGKQSIIIDAKVFRK